MERTSQMIQENHKENEAYIDPLQWLSLAEILQRTVKIYDFA